MLNYNSPIKDTKKYSEIKISEVEPTAKINLRGKKRDFITKIGKELSIIPPTDPNTSSGNDSLNILWLSPDEWLIYSNNKIDQKNIDDLEDRLYNSISKAKIGSVTNVISPSINACTFTHRSQVSTITNTAGTDIVVS